MRAVDEEATSPGTSAPGTSPLAASLDRTRRRIIEAAPVIAMVAALSFLYVMRQPTSIQTPSLFAEDGTVFFKDAIERGWAAVFDPYGGQVFVFQRIVACFIAPLPILIQPALYFAVSVSVAVMTCSIALSSRWRFAVSRNARFVCVLALVCVPGIAETYGVLSNTHWWLGVGLLLLGMLHDPTGRLTRIGEFLFVAVAALSGFAALYGLPTLAVRAYRNRSVHSTALLAPAVVGILVQVGFLVASGRHGDLGELARPLTALLILVKRVLATLALGDSNLAAVWPLRSGDLIAWMAAVALAVVVVVAWLRAPKMELAALLGVLFGGWLLALWALSYGATLDMLFWPASAARFFLVPKATVYVSLVLTPPSSPLSGLAIGAVCVLLSVGVMSDYHLAPAQTTEWAPFATCLDKRTITCTTVIPPGWTLEVSPQGN